MKYAGFWKRLIALILDIAILAAVGALTGYYLYGYVSPRHEVLVGNTLAIMLAWFYFAGFESSPWQATPGKKALRIQVVNLARERIGFGRASLRHFSKAISALAFLLGYLIAAITPRKQALHDSLTRTLVVNKVAS